MGLNMKKPKAIIKETCGRYRKSKKKEKGRMLDGFIKLTSYNCKYAGRILRNRRKHIWNIAGSSFIKVYYPLYRTARTGQVSRSLINNKVLPGFNEERVVQSSSFINILLNCCVRKLFRL